MILGRHIAIIICILMTVCSSAQETVVINLSSALESGGASNLTIAEIERAVEVSRSESQISKNWWLPTLYAGTRLHQLWGSSMNGDGRFFTDVDRQNFWGGAGLDFSWDLGRGTYDYKAQLLMERQLEVQSKAQRNQVLLNVVQTYYELLSAQLQMRVLENLVAQTDTIAGEISAQVEAGMRYESEYLLAKSEVNRLKIELLDAELVFGEKGQTMVQLLNLPPDTRLICGDSLLVPIDLAVQIPASSPRLELTSAKYGLESLEIQKNSVSKGLLLPEIRLGAYTSAFGDVFAPLNPTSAINASITWNLPLGDLLGGDQKKMFESKIALQQARTDLIGIIINQEVQTAQVRRDIAKRKMELADEGAQLAEKALFQSIQRQKAGTTIPFELVQTQEAFLRLTLSYLNAVSDYNKAQFELKVAVGEDL